MDEMKVGVLISGRGSNLAALIDSCQGRDSPARIHVVVSNVAGVLGLERARAAGVPTVVVDPKAYPDREFFDAELDAVFRASGVDLICLAGYMRILSASFVEKWPGRMLNIHPALLPSFKGLHTHRRALEAGVKLHGCTVHFVSAELDGGPIIAQAAVPVLDGDDEDSLADRVLATEHRLYPLVLRMVAQGQVTLDGSRVRCRVPAGDPTRTMFHPPV